MRFQNIPGQEKNKLLLSQWVESEKIPHAMTFYGRQGTPKLALAHALAQNILCSHHVPGDSCGMCNHCKKVSKWIHPDLHTVFPVVKKENKKREETVSLDFMGEWRSLYEKHPYFAFQDWTTWIKSENSPPNINTKECVELAHKLSLKTFEGKAKVMIIWMPEFLGKEGNRLLKLVEEPTLDTYIILVTENLQSILPTIISRTQIIHVPPYADGQIAEFIQKKLDLDIESARQIALISDGDLGKAISMINSPVSDHAAMLFEWIRVSFKGDAIKLVDFVDGLSKTGRQELKDFLQYGLSFFREYLFFLQTGQNEVRLNSEEFEIARKMTQVIDKEICFQLIEIMNEGIIHISRNANPKISFMADSIAMGNILKRKID
ncbi:MAG TPA: hypothetical protein PKC30_02155 [Saprospiraceae bacterium]|mgnify:FL=1|nr:hypothetical protein [Saprospiraceae bacterium]